MVTMCDAALLLLKVWSLVPGTSTLPVNLLEMQGSQAQTQTDQIRICILTRPTGDSCAYENLRNAAPISLS